nr:immunoglobulin light chain junction region [Macaca mulatta]MOY05074.1 immunoglobulin light chain junction region [Macaca mulatta]MOY05301.1 immunoglobulin light chain junction region [Macaca mulatta]MOY05716.1 immunoglobulin light chain junction region [Macaca mulatta]MOY05764.1 immunoglobulin light chain junction region [Macaca mulatta]
GYYCAIWHSSAYIF